MDSQNQPTAKKAMKAKKLKGEIAALVLINWAMKVTSQRAAPHQEYL